MSKKSRRSGRKSRKRWFMLLLLVVLAVMFVRSEWIGRTVYPASWYKSLSSNWPDNSATAKSHHA